MIEDPVSRGHCQRDAVTQVQLRRADATYIATCCTARLWVENFVGGKFRDLSMSHENNENWHPTKITRYTVSHCTSVKEIFCSLNIFVRRSPTVGSFIESSYSKNSHKKYSCSVPKGRL